MGKFFGKYVLVLLAVVAAGLSSCEDKAPDNTPEEPLKISRSSILVGKNAEQVSVSITARDGDWTLSGTTDWCSVDPESGDTGLTIITVGITPNEKEDEDDEEEVTSRETVLEIVSAGVRKQITVKQLAEELTNPNYHEDYNINRYIYENILSQWYLWNEEVVSTRADYNQSYDKFFSNYLMFLKKNDLDGGTWSEGNERYLYSYIERRPRNTSATEPLLNYGMEFHLTNLNSNNGTKMVGRILYVLDKSPAAAAGLKRGDWFLKINGREMGNWKVEGTDEWRYNRQLDSLVRPTVAESITLGMVKRDYAGRIVDNGETRTLTPARFRGSPILYSDVIPGTDPEGQDINTAYLIYNNFDAGPNGEYETELIQKFERFKNHDVDGEVVGVDNMILDLRYSRSGTVEMAKLMADLIAPSPVSGQTFAKYTFNSNKSAHDRTATFAPHASGIGVNRLIIITTPYTAGPAELLINGFNDLEGVELVVVGEATEGFSAGMAALPNAQVPDEDYIYNIYPVAFKCENSAGKGDYKFGISPNGQTVSEWDSDNIIWSTNWGDYTSTKSRDAFLVRALQYADGSLPLPDRAATIITSSTSKLGYPRLFSVKASMTMDVPE